MLKRKHFELVLLCCLISSVSCGDNNESSRKHSSLGFWTVGGSDGIVARFGTNVQVALGRLEENKAQLDEFLLTIAEQPLTEIQILESSGLTQSQMDYVISKLDSFKLIKKDDQDRWATTVPVITDNQMKIIRDDLTPMANSVAQYLKKETHQLKTLYDKVKSPMDPSWTDVSHLVIDKFIIDGTFHSNINRLERERDVREPDDPHEPTTPAFFLERGEHFANFGTNWYVFNQGDDQREVYVLHGAILDRYVIAMNKYRGDQHFATGFFKITSEGRIDSLTETEKEMLRYLDWIAEDRLLVPIVQAITIKAMWPMIEKIGRDAAEIAFGHFTDIINSFNNAPHSKFLDDDDDYIQVCYHALFGVIIERLVENGVVSRIPQPVPESFGVYVVFGKLF